MCNVDFPQIASLYTVVARNAATVHTQIYSPVHSSERN